MEIWSVQGGEQRGRLIMRNQESRVKNFLHEAEYQVLEKGFPTGKIECCDQAQEGEKGREEGERRGRGGAQGLNKEGWKEEHLLSISVSGTC